MPGAGSGFPLTREDDPIWSGTALEPDRLRSFRLQGKHVEVPRRVIDVQAGTRQFAPVAIVNFGSDEVCKANLLAAKLGKGQRQPALTLVSGVIDGDEVIATF